MNKREIENKKQRIRRLNNGNKNTKKYEKTKKGFLVRCYRNMLSRVTGVTKNKNHLYLGKEILDKNVFYSYSMSDESFNNLFELWEKTNYERVSTPSIDRIDSLKGYSIDNIQWITFSENCSKVTRAKKG
ncbi:hypothetical protein Phi19:1_gp014 [Cellulophaga phage phi19:1]|uniref:Uncharacterized protein n=1 Tax=Cellulophaga phage phi19:1 TaxID=1327970 RepID=R9ZVS9_9CAUD|nr:hypothetical protein Phi19:1_gp014 [Cellulophaga phage phi19:1]AGO47304.1 hypothetical protein Phi19:1_gp014 [Cellulophaga phage phi19:1]